MAAFTTFSDDALRRYLVMFDRGELVAHRPISEGIENSNYFVTLDTGGSAREFVLTIVEDLGFDDIPFFSTVTTRLSHHGLPVAAPVPTLDGMTTTIFCGKPTLLFPKLAGAHPELASADQCREIGEFLAAAHHALADLNMQRENPYSRDWMAGTLASLSDIAPPDRQLLETITGEYRLLEDSTLPRGIIHGDLFRDNALFLDGRLTGVIDYYHACTDYLVQDLAVTLNDWCRNSDGEPDTLLHDAMLAGYEQRRVLTPEEKTLLPVAKRISAARFALTRFESGNPPLKDPGEMLDLARRLQL